MIASSFMSIVTCLVAGTAFAASLEPRGKVKWINHDAVVGFPESVPDGPIGKLLTKHQPRLKVKNGCVPFPAVNAAGEVGGGLKPTGDEQGDCDKSPGQIYSRVGSYRNRTAILYNWYFPKDQCRTPSRSYKHSWEMVWVWLTSDDPETAVVTGVSYSRVWYAKMLAEDVHFYDNTHPMVEYKHHLDDWYKSHIVSDSHHRGGTQPLVDWAMLTDEARTALADANWGKHATVALVDAHFQQHMEFAWAEGF